MVVTATESMTDEDRVKSKGERSYVFDSNCDAVKHVHRIIEERLAIGYWIVDEMKENKMPVGERAQGWDIEEEGKSEMPRMNNLTECLAKRPPVVLSKWSQEKLNKIASLRSHDSCESSEVKLVDKDFNEIDENVIQLSTIKKPSATKSRQVGTGQKSQASNSKLMTPSDYYYLTAESSVTSESKPTAVELNKQNDFEPFELKQPDLPKFDILPDYKPSHLDNLDQDDINNIYDRNSHSNALFEGLSTADIDCNNYELAASRYAIDIVVRLTAIEKFETDPNPKSNAK